MKITTDYMRSILPALAEDSEFVQHLMLEFCSQVNLFVARDKAYLDQLVGRWEKGAQKYGDMDTKLETRDLHQEAFDEVKDFINYNVPIYVTRSET